MQYKSLDSFLDKVVIVGFSVAMLVVGVSAFTSSKSSDQSVSGEKYSVTVGEIKAVSADNYTASR